MFIINNVHLISFDIYLVFIICFLSIICYFISFDIRQSISDNLNLYKIDRIKVIQSDYILLIAKSYILRKEWLSCILMLELMINNIEESKDLKEYYNCLAFCFYSLNMYGKAKEYYLESIKRYPEDLNTLMSLAEVYNKSKDSNKATELYRKILSIDKNNRSAQLYLNRLL